jgi:hypothetical protein
MKGGIMPRRKEYKIVLRLPPYMKEALERIKARTWKSINLQIVDILEEYIKKQGE